jgi:hypothetical protein
MNKKKVEVLVNLSRYNILSRIMCDYRRGIDWILDLLTQLGTTSNYSAIDNLHNLQITTAPISLFPARFVFISRSLATASNSEDSSDSPPRVMSSQPPVQNFLSTQLNSLLQTVLRITSRHGPHRKHPVSNSKSIFACVFVSAGTCLPSRCWETPVCLFDYCIATVVLGVCFEVFA